MGMGVDRNLAVWIHSAVSGGCLYCGVGGGEDHGVDAERKGGIR